MMIDGLEIIAMRLNNGTDFLVFVMRNPSWPICEVVLGKWVFKKKMEVNE